MSQKFSSIEKNSRNLKNIKNSKSLNMSNNENEKKLELPKLNSNVNLKASFSTKKIFYCKKKEREMALLKQKKLLEKNLLNRIYFKEIEKILAKKKTKDIDESNNMDLFNRDLNYNSNGNEFNNNNNKLKKIFSYENINKQKFPIVSNEDKKNFIWNFNKVSIFESQKNFLKKHQPIEHKYLHLRNLTKFNDLVFKKKQFNNQHKNLLSSPNVYY